VGNDGTVERVGEDQGAGSEYEDEPGERGQERERGGEGEDPCDLLDEIEVEIELEQLEREDEGEGESDDDGDDERGEEGVDE
jgi:hypothetical protein